MEKNRQYYYFILLSKQPKQFQDFIRKHNLMIFSNLLVFLNSSKKEQHRLLSGTEYGSKESYVINTLKCIVDKVNAYFYKKSIELECSQRHASKTITPSHVEVNVNTKDVHEPTDVSIIGQQCFDEWLKHLSARALNVLLHNELTTWESLCKLLMIDGFSFSNYKNCGKKTALELNLMVDDIKKTIIISSHLNQKNDSFDIQLLLDTKLEEFNLSVRAINCLKEANIITLGELVSLDKPFLLSFKNLGDKTIKELEDLVKKNKLYFGFEINRLELNNKLNLGDDYELFNKLKLSSWDIKFIIVFYNNHGFLPMAFLLGKCIRTVLNKFELSVVEELYDTPKSEIRRKEVNDSFSRHLFEKVDKRLLSNTDIKAWTIHKDWKYYGMDKVPPCDWNNKQRDCDCRGISVPHKEFVIELEEYRTFLSEMCFCPSSHSKEMVLIDSEEAHRLEELEKENFNLWNEAYFHLGFIQRFFGMTCYWINYDTIEMCKYKSFDTSSYIGSLFIDGRFDLFKYTKALKEVIRLKNIKTEEKIIIPIKTYFIDNEKYWDKSIQIESIDKDSMIMLLTVLFKNICNVRVNNGAISINVSKMDYCERLYEILKVAGKRLHRDVLYKRLKRVCQERGFYDFDYTEPSQITPFLRRDPRIISVGKSSYWGLKEWGETIGSIRELAIYYTKKSKRPIKINDLAKSVMKERPDSNESSVTSIIRQTAATGELLLFYDDYIGYPNRDYVNDNIIMPQSFDEWMKAYKKFVEKNKHLPYENQGFEGYLKRWHYRANHYTDLTSDEIIKFDAMEKELAHYPQNANENKFLQICNLYKRYVESNKHMPTKADDLELYNWFYRTSRNYCNYDDNRNKYFSQLLQSISSILY